MKHIKKFENSDWEKSRKEKELEIIDQYPLDVDDYEGFDREEIRRSKEEEINKSIPNVSTSEREETVQEWMERRRSKERELINKFK